MNIHIRTSITVLILSLFSLSTFAQESQNRKTEFSLEIDPVTFIQNGYSAHLRLKPKSSDHLLVGLGAYAMDMPSAIVDLNKNNKALGWVLRLNIGYGLFGEYYFKESNKNFFLGSQIGLQEYKIVNDELNGSEKFRNALLMGYGGYAIQPFELPIYFKVWGGLGYTSKISGTNFLHGKEYDISPIVMFGTLHIGYTLNAKNNRFH